MEWTFDMKYSAEQIAEARASNLENTKSFMYVINEAVKWGLTCEVLTDMCKELNITTEELAIKANGAAMEWDI